LVVEDSPVVAPFTVEALQQLGCIIIGPAPNMADARRLAEETDLDAAVLDLNIRGHKIFPICELLVKRGVPFLLTSGYADWNLPERWSDRPHLQKPYTIDDLEVGLSELLG
jgi:DNA-binding response OmpR family regulator